MILANEVQGPRAFVVHLLGSRHCVDRIPFFSPAYMVGAIYLKCHQVQILRLLDIKQLTQDPHMGNGGAKV